MRDPAIPDIYKDTAEAAQILVQAADRAGRRRLAAGEKTHGIPSAPFFYSRFEASSMVEALDGCVLDERLQAIRRAPSLIR